MRANVTFAERVPMSYEQQEREGDEAAECFASTEIERG